MQILSVTASHCFINCIYAEFSSMNSNLKMTVERSKRRSYFLSLVFITKWIRLVFSIFASPVIKLKIVTRHSLNNSRILDMIDDGYAHNLAENQVSVVFYSSAISSPEFSGSSVSGGSPEAKIVTLGLRTLKEMLMNICSICWNIIFEDWG